MTTTLPPPARTIPPSNVGSPVGEAYSTDPQSPRPAMTPLTPKTPAPVGAPTPESTMLRAHAQAPHVGSGQSPRPAKQPPTPAQVAPVGAPTPEPTRGAPRTHMACVGSGQPLADPTLALAADILDDLERVKVANANRLRQLTRGGRHDERIKSGKFASVADLPPDQDGRERGFGLDEDHPDVERLAAMVDGLTEMEHAAVLNLQRTLRKHPLGPWVKEQRGVGEKQAARLLATIGDPGWNTLHDRPRTVSELWAYCGLRPGQRRQKGVKSNWSAKAKSCSWLVVESCMKQIDCTCPRAVVDGKEKRNHVDNPACCLSKDGVATHLEVCRCSPYRIKVDERRAHTTATHPEWTPAHSLNDGMRVAAKELLKHLWREARRITLEGEAS